MRAPDLLTLALATAAACAPAVLRAQDPTDSLPAESADSIPETDDWPEPDPGRRPERHSGEGNPYLREVREEAPAPYRGPIWVSGSLGAGGEAIAASGVPGPYSRSRLAPTVSFGIGGTVGQQLRMGFEGFVWIHPMGGGTVETVTAGLVTGRVYPLRTSGLFLKSGFGFGRYGQDVIDDCGCDSELVADYGFAWVIGGGFEAPVGRGLWVGPTVEMLRMNVTGPDGYRERVINFGISITYDGRN
jgi:hypothetical protein